MTKNTHLILNKQQQINILNQELAQEIEHNLDSFKDNFYFHFNENKNNDVTNVEMIFTVPHLTRNKYYQSAKELTIDFCLIEDDFLLFMHFNNFEDNIPNKIATLYLNANELKNSGVDVSSWFDEYGEIMKEDMDKPSNAFLKKTTQKFWDNNIYQIKESQYSLVEFIQQMNLQYTMPYLDKCFKDMDKKDIFMKKYEVEFARLIEASKKIHTQINQPH